MTIVELLLYWIAPIIAIVYVVGYSYLFEPLRSSTRIPTLLAALLDCPMCIGWWAGVFVGALNVMSVQWPAWIQYPVLGGCLAIAVQYLLELMRRNHDSEEATTGEDRR